MVRLATEQDVTLGRGSTPHTTAKNKSKKKQMEDLLEWQKMIRKNNRRRWNEPKKLEKDISGLAYAKRKGVTCVYVDTETGEIMQFGTSKSLANNSVLWDGMFPTRKMQAVYTKDYEKFIEELIFKQKNNKL